MRSSYVVPISIVVLGALVAGAIFLISRAPNTQNGSGQKIDTLAKMRLVDASDHIAGNPNAPVIVVTYSDMECPYCKEFDVTMTRIMDYYGASGKVAWVFRNFPLAQLHSKAPTEAQAAECAAAQGGNDAFFKYIHAVFSVTPSNNDLDLAQLPLIAKSLALNSDTFAACMADKTVLAKVQQQYDEAIAMGLQGTPASIIVVNGKATLELGGNQPYASMRAAIDETLRSIGETVGTSTPTTTQ